MVILPPRRPFISDQRGGAMVETLIVINLLLLIVIAFVEFAVAMNQWNLAAKAVQVGGRLAAVSDPVDSALSSWDGLGPDDATPPFPGEPVADDFEIVCTGKDASCTVTGTYSGDPPTYNAAAMNRLIDGSDSAEAGFPHCDASGPRLGMCDVLPRVRAENVNVRYQFTGLGYAGRPGGLVPTITVSLTGLQFDFLLLGSLLGLDNRIDLPSFVTTFVGEDLSSSYIPP